MTAKTIRNWLPQLIADAHTEDTGGGCMADVLTLRDGRVLVITEDVAILYPSMSEWNEPTKEWTEYPQINLGSAQ